MQGVTLFNKNYDLVSILFSTPLFRLCAHSKKIQSQSRIHEYQMNIKAHNTGA
jgi:hypothetical protein